ncbi:LysR family transcriptional regulator [Photobacterium sp. SDRW27]|uniref:LysR family transcriptional regulator n=1 Tax=Photobacterium obscurum TaxID=2829490 RepID=UPI002244C018|nr:LysR family transcriptional regulator [Photobacterium obscurum]MCW8328629.1 LysR family transcriptional regulator [Photobacterium obscurum]
MRLVANLFLSDHRRFMDKNYKQFLVVAELGNISLAAHHLGLSQPTLTNNMKKLEGNFGVPLFIRKSKGVELTEYGKLLQEQALELQRRHDSLLHKMADLKERRTEKIRMGTGDAWWEVFVKQALQQYSCEHPSISIQLEFGNHLKLMDMLVHGQIDLFVGHEIVGLSRRCNVSFIPLLQDKEAMFVHQSHPLLVNKRQDSDTELYPLLQVTPDSEAYQHLIENPQPKQLERERKKVSERIVYEINSLTASVDLLTSTTAVMPYPMSMADYFSKSDIVALPLDQAGQAGTVGIYHLNEVLAEHVLDIKQQLVLSGQIT